MTRGERSQKGCCSGAGPEHLLGPRAKMARTKGKIDVVCSGPGPRASTPTLTSGATLPNMAGSRIEAVERHLPPCCARSCARPRAARGAGPPAAEGRAMTSGSPSRAGGATPASSPLARPRAAPRSRAAAAARRRARRRARGSQPVRERRVVRAARPDSEVIGGRLRVLGRVARPRPNILQACTHDAGRCSLAR